VIVALGLNMFRMVGSGWISVFGSMNYILTLLICDNDMTDCQFGI